MKIIFYNILSITVGLILVYYGIRLLMKTKKLVFPIITFVHAALFIAFGILGFFVPDDYSFMTILAMLAFTVTLLLCFLLWGKKENTDAKK